MSDRVKRLQQAQDASTAMLDAAMDGRWAEATRLQGQCARLLDGSSAWSDAERQSLGALQECHRKVQDLAIGARDEIADKLGRHRQVYRALSTYLHSAEDA